MAKMEQRIAPLLQLSLVPLLLLGVFGNFEGDVLYELKNNLHDPNGVLQSWNVSLPDPCTWLHVTCDSENRITRIDLGNANLSGKLTPRLGQLKNLQYLELYSNKLRGRIPHELGNLRKLVSMDLYLNSLTGSIPATLGNLQKLRFLRLNNNSLSGPIPVSLTTISTLAVLDLSYNKLSGLIPINGSFAKFTYMSFAGNKLTYPPMPPTQPPVWQAPAASPGYWHD